MNFNVPCSRIGRTFNVIHHHCNNQLGTLSHIASSECISLPGSNSLVP